MIQAIAAGKPSHEPKINTKSKPQSYFLDQTGRFLGGPSAFTDKFLQQISDILNRITEGFLVVILTGMAMVVFLQVIFRYLLNLPLFWTEELARYCLVWASLLGSAVAVKRGQHIAVTIFMDRLPKALRRGLTIFALIAVATILAIILWGGIQLVTITRAQISPALRLSMSIPYLAVPVGAFLMLLHTIVYIFATLAPKEPEVTNEN